MTMAQMLLQTEIRAKELRQTNVDVKLVLVGKKGTTYFNRRQDQYNIAGAVIHRVGAQPGIAQLAAAQEPVASAELNIHSTNWLAGFRWRAMCHISPCMLFLRAGLQARSRQGRLDPPPFVHDAGRSIKVIISLPQPACPQE